jgi:hypothetical protein
VKGKVLGGEVEIRAEPVIEIIGAWRRTTDIGDCCGVCGCIAKNTVRRGELVFGPEVGPGVEMAGCAGLDIIAAHLHVPEQGFA